MMNTILADFLKKMQMCLHNFTEKPLVLIELPLVK